MVQLSDVLLFVTKASLRFVGLRLFVVQLSDVLLFVTKASLRFVGRVLAEEVDIRLCVNDLVITNVAVTLPSNKQATLHSTCISHNSFT